MPPHKYIVEHMWGQLAQRAGMLFRFQSSSHASMDVLSKLFPSGSYYLTWNGASPQTAVFYRRASHCFPGNAPAIFHHVCAQHSSAHCVGAGPCVPQDRSVSLGGIRGTGNCTPVFGTNWRALPSPSHPTAQVGCDISELPADGYGHGSSSCCDGVRAVNAIACVSRSLRCFLQGRRENERHTQQADVATWAQGHVNLRPMG